MQFGIPIRVGPENRALDGDVGYYAATISGTFVGVWPIEKHCKA